MHKIRELILFMTIFYFSNSAISDDRTIDDALYFINNLPSGIDLGAELKPGTIISYENFKITGNLLTFERSRSTSEGKTSRSLVSIQMNATELPFLVGPFDNCKYAENCYRLMFPCQKKKECSTERRFRQDGTLSDSGTSFFDIVFHAREKNALRLKAAFEFIGKKLGSIDTKNDQSIKF